MTIEPPSEWTDWRDQYLRFLREVEGVSTPRKYVEEYGNVEGKELEGAASILLDEMGERLDGFERVPVANDQRLGLVFINPHLVFSGDIDANTMRSNNHNYRLSQIGPEAWTERIGISQEGEFGWLKNQNGVRAILELVAAETDLIDEETARLEDPEEAAQSIYLTNWYKFATSKGSGIPTGMAYPGSFPSRILREELNEIGPELIITFGKKPWEYGLSPAVRPLHDSVKAGVTKNQNAAFQYSWRDTSAIVIPYPMQRWAISVSMSRSYEHRLGICDS